MEGNAPVPADHSSYEGRAQQSLTTAWPPAALISSAMTLSTATQYDDYDGSDEGGDGDGDGGEKCGEGRGAERGERASQPKRFLPT